MKFRTMFPDIVSYHHLKFHVKQTKNEEVIKKLKNWRFFFTHALGKQWVGDNERP